MRVATRRNVAETAQRGDRPNFQTPDPAGGTFASLYVCNDNFLDLVHSYGYGHPRCFLLCSISMTDEKRISAPRLFRRAPVAWRRSCAVGAACAAAAILPQAAHAYVGPGAGLTALGTVIALILALVLAIVGFVWYPLKRLRRKRNSRSDAGKAARERE